MEMQINPILLNAHPKSAASVEERAATLHLLSSHNQIFIRIIISFFGMVW